MHTVDIAIIVVYLLAVIAAGFILSRRAAAGVEGYFLGGRTIPWYVLGISNASGMFDITGTMWMVMLLFVYGLKSIWVPWVWPTFNQVFMMIFLAAWVRRSGALTGADWLRTRFGRGVGLELAHLSVVLFALVSVIAFIAYAFVGVGKFGATVLPGDLSPNTYAIIALTVTGLYVIAGGMYSVVFTDILQFLLLTAASVMVGYIAMTKTSAATIAAATPTGWDSLWFGWKLNLDWSQLVPAANQAIKKDGYEFFAPFLGMAFFKGVLSSIAGPTPGYDMQRVLAAKNDREASLMSGVVSLVLFIPRYFLIAGIAVLALTYYSGDLAAQAKPDFESILPYVIETFIPIGVAGILMAGLLAAFMSTFDSTVNAGAAYFVVDVFKRYLAPESSEQLLLRISYLASLVIIVVGMIVGMKADNINEQLQWIVGGLFGGYAAPNMLKWIWWRLNGVGYFAGMVSGVAVALAITQKDGFLEWCGTNAPAVSAALDPIAPYLNALYLFPLLLLVSGLAAIVFSLITPPDDDETLMAFYRSVRPWGFWRPVREMVEDDDQYFEDDSNFGLDMFNCAVGIAWQIALCAFPVFVVIRNWPAALCCLGIIVVTMLVLKFSWYDRLEATTQ